MPALVEHFIQQVLAVGLEQVILLRLPGAGASAAPAPRLFLYDRGDVPHVVRQRQRHILRFFSPIAPLLLHDPLGNCRRVFRQRHLADLVQLQIIQRLTGFLAQLQPGDRDAYRRLAVPVQPPLCPGLQVFFCALALVGFPVIHPSIQALVLAQVIAVNMQVVLSGRVDPGVHPAPAHAPL